MRKFLFAIAAVSLLGSVALSQEQLRWAPRAIEDHRTITALDGFHTPLYTNSSWESNPNGKKVARFYTNLVVRGTTALGDDPTITFRPYYRRYQTVGGGTSVTYVRPRLQDAPAVKCQKTVNAGVAYTDYSAAVIDNSAGTVADLSSLDTIANGDWVVIGANVQAIGAAWNVTTANANAATFTVQYWDGDSWESLANGTDGTASGGATFAVDGQMTWDQPADWATSTLNSITAYWVRIGVSAALDADTTLEEMDLLLPIQAAIDAEAEGDDAMLLIESISSVTGTIAYSGTFTVSWR